MSSESLNALDFRNVFHMFRIKLLSDRSEGTIYVCVLIS